MERKTVPASPTRKGIMPTGSGRLGSSSRTNSPAHSPGRREPPVQPQSFPALLDAARQQTELVVWVAQALNDHEERLTAFAEELAGIHEKEKTRAEWSQSSSKPTLSKIARKLATKKAPEAVAESPRSNKGGNVAKVLIQEAEKDTATETDSNALRRESHETDIRRSKSKETKENEGIEQSVADPVSPTADGSKLSQPESEHSGTAMVATMSDATSVEGVNQNILQEALDATERAMEDMSAQFEKRLEDCVEFLKGRMWTNQRHVVEMIEPVATKLVDDRSASMVADMMASVELKMSELRESISQDLAHLAVADQKDAGADREDRRSPPLIKELPEPQSPQSPHAEVVAHQVDQPDQGCLPKEVAEMVERLTQEVSEMQRALPEIEDTVSSLKWLKLEMPTLKMEMTELVERMGQVEIDIDSVKVHIVSAPQSPEKREVSREESKEARKSVSSEAVSRQVSQDAPRPGPEEPSVNSEVIDQLIQDVAQVKETLEWLSVKSLESENQSAQAAVAVKKVSGLETSVGEVQEKIQTVDSDLRAQYSKLWSKVRAMSDKCDQICNEDVRKSQTWNLAEQVDVIQSLIGQELTSLRHDLDQRLKAAEFIAEQRSGGRQSSKEAARRASQTGPAPVLSPKGPTGPTATDSKIVEELDGKIKRLQEVSQQCILKLSGIKTAAKHGEGQLKYALDRGKKLSAEVDELTEQSVRNAKSIEYIMMRLKGGGDEGSLGSPKSPGLRKGRNPKTPDIADGGGGGGDGGTETLQPLQPGDDAMKARMNKMAKKIHELDDEFGTGVENIKKLVERVSYGLNMILSFLPRKQRRLIEKAMHVLQKTDAGIDDAPDEEHVPKTREGGAKVVTFSRQEPETRSFIANRDDEDRMPWQIPGEVDAKWNWCFQNDLGLELARHLELVQHEREEFENDMKEALEQMKAEMQNISALKRRAGNTTDGSVRYHRGMSGASRGPANEAVSAALGAALGAAPSAPASPSGAVFEAPSEGAVGSGGGDSMGAMMGGTLLLQKKVMPLVHQLEKTVEKLTSELKEEKRKVESLSKMKASNEQLELVTMRMAKFDKFDPASVDHRFETVERDAKNFEQSMQHLTELFRKLEGSAAQRSDVSKLRSEVKQLFDSEDRQDKDIKALGNTMAVANQKLSSMLTETKGALEHDVNILKTTKATITDFNSIQERMVKLEASMRDNRALLGEAGVGQEMNAIVKRIILNLEDKIMVLEKKVNALVDGHLPRAEQSPDQRPQSSPRDRHPHIGPETPEVLNNELLVLSDALVQLRQDLGLSKAELDHLTSQSKMTANIMDRMQVVVDNIGSRTDDEGTVLSMNRVQVMIASAARQLLSSNKWVTREGFDDRFSEARREYMGSIRQLQAQLDDISDGLGKVSVGVDAGQARLPKVLPLPLQDAKATLTGTSASRLFPEPQSARKMASARPRTGVATATSGGLGLLPENQPLIRRPQTKGVFG